MQSQGASSNLVKGKAGARWQLRNFSGASYSEFDLGAGLRICLTSGVQKCNPHVAVLNGACDISNARTDCPSILGSLTLLRHNEGSCKWISDVQKLLPSIEVNRGWPMQSSTMIIGTFMISIAS